MVHLCLLYIKAVLVQEKSEILTATGEAFKEAIHAFLAMEHKIMQ